MKTLLTTTIALAATAAVAAPATSLAATTADPERAPQMTGTEFQRIQYGMTKDRVRNIVGAAGQRSSSYSNLCEVRSYSSSRGGEYLERYYVMFENARGRGLRVTAKARPGGVLICPQPS